MTGVATKICQQSYIPLVVPVLFWVYQIPRPRVLCDSEWSCGGRESLGEGVIKADYGEAEGRVGQHICLPQLMSGGRESRISCLAFISPLPPGLSQGRASWKMRRGQVHVHPLALSLQAGGVPVPPAAGNWGTLASSGPRHSASASLNQAKNTQPTHGPLFGEDRFTATLKQSLTTVHKRCDTTIFHFLFKSDHCYEARAIQ